MRRAAAALVLLVTPTVLSGCATDVADPEAKGESVLEAGAPVLSQSNVDDLHLPLDDYSLSSTEYLAIQQAAWTLTAACVERFGGSYTLRTASMAAAIRRDPMGGNDRRYGLVDLSTAQQYGYQLPDEEGDLMDERRWDPSPRELLLVRGEVPDGQERPKTAAGKKLPEGGCLGEANQVFSRGQDVDPETAQLMQTLRAETFFQAEADPLVVEATRLWSECMDERGFSYASPRDANNSLGSRALDRRQIETAVADVECKTATNYVGVFSAVESAYQRRAIRENAAALSGVPEALRADLEAATSASERSLRGTPHGFESPPDRHWPGSASP